MKPLPDTTTLLAEAERRMAWLCCWCWYDSERIQVRSPRIVIVSGSGSESVRLPHATAGHRGLLRPGAVAACHSKILLTAGKVAAHPTCTYYTPLVAWRGSPSATVRQWTISEDRTAQRVAYHQPWG